MRERHELGHPATEKKYSKAVSTRTMEADFAALTDAEREVVKKACRGEFQALAMGNDSFERISAFLRHWEGMIEGW